MNNLLSLPTSVCILSRHHICHNATNHEIFVLLPKLQCRSKRWVIWGQKCGLVFPAPIGGRQFAALSLGHKSLIISVHWWDFRTRRENFEYVFNYNNMCNCSMFIDDQGNTSSKQGCLLSGIVSIRGVSIPPGGWIEKGILGILIYKDCEAPTHL